MHISCEIAQSTQERLAVTSKKFRNIMESKLFRLLQTKDGF